MVRPPDLIGRPSAWSGKWGFGRKIFLYHASFCPGATSAHELRTGGIEEVNPMWKQREEAPRSTSGSSSVLPPLQPAAFPDEFDRARGGLPTVKDALAAVGKSIVIKGELSGDEDLTIEGRVEGTIELRNHVLTIGSNGHV